MIKKLHIHIIGTNKNGPVLKGLILAGSAAANWTFPEILVETEFYRFGSLNNIVFIGTATYMHKALCLVVLPVLVTAVVPM